MSEMMKEFARQGKCVLVITHDLELIYEACRYQIRLPMKTHFDLKGKRQ
jgi:ABC-type Mn2+/Zn2+ transport system ATPase subunit